MGRMIQRFERVALPSNRTVPVTAIERIMPAAGSTLALPFGEIAGDFRASGRVDKQRRRAIYELLIANNTPAPVATFAYALEGVSQTRITWDAIIVPAHSAVSVEIDVAMPPSGREPRMIAEIYAHESKLVLDARTDARGPARRLARRAIATFAGLAVVLTGTLAYASMRPSVVATRGAANRPERRDVRRRLRRACERRRLFRADPRRHRSRVGRARSALRFVLRRVAARRRLARLRRPRVGPRIARKRRTNRTRYGTRAAIGSGGQPPCPISRPSKLRTSLSLPTPSKAASRSS